MNVAFDLETHLIAPGVISPMPVCCSVAWADDASIVLDIEAQIAWHLDEGHTLIAHNAAFDVAVLLTWYPALRAPLWSALDEGRVRCTKLREQLISIAHGALRDYDYSLAAIVKRRFGVVVDKGADTWRLRYAELDGVPLADWPDDAVRYSIDDARWCLRLHDEQEIDATFMRTQDVETRASVALQLMSANGFVVDQAAVRALSTTLCARKDELTSRLLADGILVPKRGRAGGVRKDTGRIAALVAERGSTATTPTGRPKLTREILDDVGGFDDLVEYSQVEKSWSTYVRGLVGVEAVHARYHALGASSGRTSCSAPNMQNLPRLPGVRECFVPRDGYRLIACDFDSQEMRTLAQACHSLVGRSALAERYREDTDFDPHSALAAESGLTRQDSKAGNFGFPGGMGIAAFIRFAKSRGVVVDESRAYEIKSAWFKQWPEMRAFFQHVGALSGIDEHEAEIVIPGTGFVRGGCGYTDACNGYFQGLAATCSKEALYRVSRACHDPTSTSWLLGSRPVAFVHDEVLVESPAWCADAAADDLVDEMVEGMARWCPDVPATASARVMDRWSK